MDNPRIGKRVDVLRSGVRAMALLGLAAGGLIPRTGHAEQLQNFIKDLYGGNGIFLAVNPGAFSHSAHFASESLEKLSDLNRDVARNVALTSFTPSAPSLYFNILEGMPSQASNGLGPIFGERAETIGRGKLSVGASFSHVHFTSFNGSGLNDISVITEHQPVTGCTLASCSFLEDQVKLDINLDITRDVFAVYSQYGITDRWDVGIILPMVIQTATASSVATIVNNSGTNVHSFDAAHPATSRAGGTASGLGDIILRTKYNFLRGDPILPDLAVFGQLNLPTGSKENLIGTGSTDTMLGLIASKQFGPVNPHLVVGYQVASGGYDRNNLQYTVGADYRVTADLALAGDFIGRWYTGPGGQLNSTDFSIGMKWRPFGQHVLVADFLVPINKSVGLRPDYVAFAGYQYTF